MECRVSRDISNAPQRIWSVLEDVRHFARNDPFHHDFAYLSSRKSGLGTAFRMRHTYFPIFPLAADEVVCTVTQWQPERTLTLLEKNQKKYRTHTQRFTLVPQGTKTIVE